MNPQLDRASVAFLEAVMIGFITRGHAYGALVMVAALARKATR